MPHRKPLGTTCRISFAKDAWGTVSPIHGEYLESKAGTVYLVTGIEDGPVRNTYVLERVASYPADAIVFGFYWLPRG